jgi:Zn-dependent M28 family amino/carboxypeptidase
VSRVAGLIAASAVVIVLVAIHQGARLDVGRTAEGFDGARAFKDLERLVAVGPRPPDSQAIERAREYITAQLGTAGVEVQRDPFIAMTPVGSIPMVNIVGVLSGTSSNLVIVAGHYDTARLKGIAFVGANDGGSSAAELLELARVLSRRRHVLTYWLVFFDGEEALEQWSQTDSLYGSRHLAEELATNGRLAELQALVLVDMVAGRQLHILEESSSTKWLRQIVLKKARELGYASSFDGGQFPVEDDHLPFGEKGVAAVDIIDLTPFKTYHHTAQDTPDKCSPASLAIVGRVVLATLEELERRFGMACTGMQKPQGAGGQY